jgi:type IV pilus assembly protein PilC
MAKFLYKAKDTTGNLVSGTVTAENQVEAEDVLRKNNFLLIDLETANTVDIGSIFHRFPDRDKGIFVRQLSTMVAAGIPLPKAIGVIASQTSNEFIKSIYYKLVDDLERGQSFSVVLSQFPRFFTPVMVAVIRSGEQTGNLEEVLKQLSIQMERDSRLISKIKNAMIYPIVIVVAMVAIAAAMLIFVIPKFKDIFAASNSELPVSTKMLIGLSDSLVSGWYYYLVALIFLFFLARSILISDQGLYSFDLFKIKTPIVSPIAKGIYMTRLSQTMSMLNRSGVPILESIKIVSSVINNQVYQEGLDYAASQVEKGIPLSVPLGKNPYFPPLVSQMIAVGEETGHLESVMEKLGEFYEEETDDKIKNIASLIEPIILVVLGIAVAFVMISILTPIYRIAQLQ